MTKTYRNGALGTLMDEYERATIELQHVLLTIDSETYKQIIDVHTKDKDCISIQTIMNHVVRSGFGYSNLIRKEFGETYIKRKTQYDVDTPEKAVNELNLVLQYADETLCNKWHLSSKEISKHIIHTAWGQSFDIDQLMEHAIVHILRHRRQIEKFLSMK
mgnify:CR=1 FL=1